MKTVVVNNSIKPYNHRSPQIIEHQIKTYDVGNPGSGLVHAKLLPVGGILTLPSG
jgi:hypothetical protein